MPSREAPAASPIPFGHVVRERLRARLIDRRTSELVASLTRRHGDGWSAYVLQGGFCADEEMRRICEAFGLRADLERQVLRNAIERAKLRKPEVTLMEAPPSPVSSCRQEAVPGEVMEPESDGNCSSTASPMLSAAPCPQILQAEDLDSDDAESLGWVTLERATDVHPVEDAPKLWHARWRNRVLHTLGLDRWWPRSKSSQTVQPETESGEVIHRGGSLEEVLAEAGLSGLVDGEQDDEDMAISSKLITAMMNAERHAAAARSGDLHDMCGDDLFGSCSPEVRGRSKRRRPPKVQFADDSQVSFFDMELTGCAGEASMYKRSLQTKVFDGPSGHKARRAGSESSEEDDSDEEEDWEDRCDDIAELMSRQRTMLLWSESW